MAGPVPLVGDGRLGTFEFATQHGGRGRGEVQSSAGAVDGVDRLGAWSVVDVEGVQGALETLDELVEDLR